MNLFSDLKGQISMEYVLGIGLVLVIILNIAGMVNNSNELNLATSAARNGAMEGICRNNLALYPVDAFSEYDANKERLNFPSSIQIVGIETINQGFNHSYGKTKIQIRVYISAPGFTNKTYKNSLGSRINYHVRRSISKVFATENISNNLYNPAFSHNYVFTTAEVRWI